MGFALVSAAAGVVGTAVFTDRGARPGTTSAITSAAGMGEPTELTAYKRTESGRPAISGHVVNGMLAPSVVTLIDAPSVRVSAGLGNDFRLTLGGDRTLANPTGGLDGQRITFTITQGAGAPHKITWASEYKFGAAGEPLLSTTDGRADIIGFVYHHSLGAWLCVGAARGF